MAGSFAEFSDESLLAAFVSAESSHSDREAAFQELVVRYRHRIFAVCVRILRSTHDAEEAVQETFLRLMRNADSFRGDAKLSTWLYRVAHNVCTDHVRYDSRRPATPTADLTEFYDRPDENDSIDGHATLDSLRGALAALDEESRLLLLMVSVDGLSYADAAEAVGVAVGTAKSRVSRARVRLGQLLAAADVDSASSNGDGLNRGLTQSEPPREHPTRGPPA